MRSCRIPASAFLFVAEALGTAAYGFQRPARNALTPRLVREDQLLPAIAVEDVIFTLARVTGPVLGGVPDLGRRARRRLRDRHCDLRRLAACDLAAAAGSACARRRPAEPSLDRGRVPLRLPAEGAARDLRGRHERDDLRNAARALPGPCGEAGRRRGHARAALRGDLGRGAARLAHLRLDDDRPPSGARRLRRGGGVGRRDRVRRLCGSRLGRDGLPRGCGRRGLRQRRPPLEHPAHGDAGLDARPAVGNRAGAGGGGAGDRERRGGHRRLADERPRFDRLGRSPHRRRHGGRRGRCSRHSSVTTPAGRRTNDADARTSSRGRCTTSRPT